MCLYLIVPIVNPYRGNGVCSPGQGQRVLDDGYPTRGTDALILAAIEDGHIPAALDVQSMHA